MIPRLAHAPKLEDFLTMAPAGEVASQMAKITRFIQQQPRDGDPVSERTEAYLGYDAKNLYVVFVCFDDPLKVRAHETRREDFYEDDDVAIMLDTFRDRRRAFEFEVNPKGIQWDAIWTEQSYADTGGNFDVSFDTLWYSRGKLTAQGYVAWMAIPFRSLRFSAAREQTWGIVLLRDIARKNEKVFWPYLSLNQEGRLGQSGTATGLAGISPGRNIQLIPYGLLNSFHTVDDRSPTPCPTSSDPAATCAHYQDRAFGGTFGLDGKMILKDSLVLDMTANPDFSQVESDEPQVTVNQRYRVLFPEKRPFFIENGDHFRTPIDLFFTRNIVNPDAGIRLTGKTGPYALGFMASDDRALGLSVSPGDSLFKTHDLYSIARVSRDVFNQSSIGAMYTDWEYPAANAYNRVGGIDSRLKFSPKLTSTLQAVVSSSECSEQYSSTFGTCSAGYTYGSAYRAELDYTSRQWGHSSVYKDYSPGFFTQPGFVTRVDIREYRDYDGYVFRPKDSAVLSWGPEFGGHWTWDHTGLRLDTDYAPDLTVVLKRQTHIVIYPYEEFRERLRPNQDFSAPPGTPNLDFHEHGSGFNASSAPFSQLTLSGSYWWGDSINFAPALNAVPYLAHFDQASATTTIHPFSRLKIDNTYLFSRLRTLDGTAAIFNNHIIRTKWNWQLTRELSLRAILEYNAALTRNSPAIPADEFPYTATPTSKNFNTDILITYMVHPGTALYIGYNTNLQNLDPALQMDPILGGVHNNTRMINDGRLFFIKASYMFRF